MRTSFSSFLSLILITGIVFVSSAPSLEAASKRSSKATFEETVSVNDLMDAYATAASGGEKVRILLMPGHEPDFGCT